MGGFFGFFDYSKPGPGVDKDEPPKARFYTFIDIYMRKFRGLIKLNLLFSLFNIPAIVISFIVVQVFLFPHRISEYELLEGAIRIMVQALLLLIPVITFGPAQAGFTFVLRNYSREDHAFVWSDFKEHAFKNLKQSLVISLIDILVTAFVGFLLNFYLSTANGNVLYKVIGGLILLGFVIFLMMHIFIYPLLVTFKLRVRDIYKNAFIFTVLSFKANIGIILICLIFIVLAFYSPYIGILLLLLLLFSTVGLITNFHAYPLLKKYMIEKAEEQQNAPESIDGK
ncbi:MAG TPA: hypothetical protein VF941_02275 [Clostridia bacterium]